MSKLSELYELRRQSQEIGMEWTEKQERQLEAEEEQIIKNDSQLHSPQNPKGFYNYINHCFSNIGNVYN